jgi:hypothetical protein
VVRREGDIPPLHRLSRSRQARHPRVVHQAGDGKLEGDDLRGGASGTGDVGEVAHHRHDVAAVSSLDLRFDLAELAGVAAYQYDGVVLREFERGAAADSGRWPGDDPRLGG